MRSICITGPLNATITHADTNELNSWTKFSFQAVMPATITNITACQTHAGYEPAMSGGCFARFVVDLWGENQAAGEAAEAILGSVAVALVGAGWSKVIAESGGVGSYSESGTPY